MQITCSSASVFKSVKSLLKNSLVSFTTDNAARTISIGSGEDIADITEAIAEEIEETFGATNLYKLS